MQLYVVRHGRTEWNEKGLMQGRQDSPLTQEGMEAARRLGKALCAVPFQAAYTSPSGRARHTAELILGGRDEIPLYDDEHLLERGLGSLEGQPLHEARARHEAVNGFFDIPDAESLASMRVRVCSLLDDIVAGNRAHTLLVSHAVTCRMLTAHLRGDGSKEVFFAQPWLPNAHALCFFYENGTWREEETI